MCTNCTMPSDADEFDLKCVDRSRRAPEAYLPPLPPLPPPPPPLPPPPPQLPMMVSGGGCAVFPPAGQCVRSTGYGGTGYSNNEACRITNPPAVPISVTSFSVEAHSSCAWDHLTVNGARYCGSNSPEGIVPDGTSIEWRGGCGDTPNWSNGRPFDSHEYGCAQYVSRGWCCGQGACPGKEGKLGAYYNHPEKNCAACHLKTFPLWELCFPQAPPPPPPPSPPLLKLYGQPIGDATGNARQLKRLLGPLAVPL